jgi:glyoxylase-like metal-dependent hydrolase (beta-lactamase superfamily II)
MPGSLGHINSWLLDDADGIAVVDSGMLLRECSDAWKALFDGDLKDSHVTRVFGTHLHPDHIGLAGWLSKKFDCDVWMTRGEWLTARMLSTDVREDVPPEALALQRSAGLPIMRLGSWLLDRAAGTPMVREKQRLRQLLEEQASPPAQPGRR